MILQVVLILNTSKSVGTGRWWNCKNVTDDAEWVVVSRFTPESHLRPSAMRHLLEVKQKPWKSFALVRMEVEAHTGGPWLELRHPWTDESI